MENYYNSLLHIYTMEGQLKMEKEALLISKLPDEFKEEMLRNLNNIVFDLERQLGKEVTV